MSDAPDKYESSSPTYADELERAGSMNISYTASYPFFTLFNCSSVLLGPIAVFIALSGLLPRSYVTPPLVPLITVFSFFLLLVLVSVGRVAKIRLVNGRLRIYRLGIPVQTINLNDVRWVGAYRKRRYVFTAAGKRISIPRPNQRYRNRNELEILSLLFRLGRMRVEEDVGYALESGTTLRAALSRGASTGRLPVLIIGLLTLVFIGFTVPGLLVAYAIMNKDLFLIFIAIIIFPVSFAAAHALYRWLRSFFAAYGLVKEEFGPEGITIGDKLVPYRDTRLRLFRGSGGMDDPCAGLLMLYSVGNYPRLIGAERENFFIITKLLQSWAREHFAVYPISKIPSSAFDLAEPGGAWIPPQEMDGGLARALTKPPEEGADK
ncbi:MAG: hypothetical protein ACYS8W_05555 [Planctomycetota bacterium]|jgi:hypothetical protein